MAYADVGEGCGLFADFFVGSVLSELGVAGEPDAGGGAGAPGHVVALPLLEQRVALECELRVEGADFHAEGGGGLADGFVEALGGDEEVAFAVAEQAEEEEGEGFAEALFPCEDCAAVGGPFQEPEDVVELVLHGGAGEDEAARGVHAADAEGHEGVVGLESHAFIGAHVVEAVGGEGGEGWALDAADSVNRGGRGERGGGGSGPLFVAASAASAVVPFRRWVRRNAGSAGHVFALEGGERELAVLSAQLGVCGQCAVGALLEVGEPCEGALVFGGVGLRDVEHLGDGEVGDEIGERIEFAGVLRQHLGRVVGEVVRAAQSGRAGAVLIDGDGEFASVGGDDLGISREAFALGGHGGLAQPGGDGVGASGGERAEVGGAGQGANAVEPGDALHGPQREQRDGMVGHVRRNW